MTVGIALALLLATLYISALAYTLPVRSRSRLAERLTAATREQWLDWLDRHEGELHMLTGLIRLALCLTVLAVIWLTYTRDLGYPPHAWTAATVVLVTLLLLAIFAVAIPYAISLHTGEAVLARSLHVLTAVRFVLWPVGRLFHGIEFVVRRLSGKADSGENEDSERAEQEILDAISEGEAHGAVDEEQKEMIESVIELGETPVSKIMTPRTDIDAIPADATYDEVRRVILEKGHSRLPVYEGSIDHIVGVLYAKDLLGLDLREPFDARAIMRKVPYVPETKTLDELLNEFRAAKVQIAIVLDEYGGTAGLATIEDILEELVGEIDDEYDQRPPPTINRLDENTLEVDARVHVTEINEELGITLPEEGEYETIGGFVFATLGKIPSPGEEFQHENVRFHIVAAEPRRINRLRIHVLRPAETA